jgi:hypothetical protein
MEPFMGEIKKLLKILALKSDIINTVLGIILVISLILIYFQPANKVIIFLACMTGSLINIMNGITISKDPKKKMNGITYLFMGVLLIVLGFLLTQYFIR